MKTIAQELNVTDFPFKIKDKNGNEIYHEDSTRSWYKYEYDSNGNKIYYEDSDKDWWKREYDSNGNRIYQENSNGSWNKSEYDSNGKLIYSGGVIEDNRPKGCEGKVVEIDGKKYKLTEL